MHIAQGDTVQFKHGLYEDEEGAVYKVLEVNGDRVVIELVNTNMSIRPQSVALVSELILMSDTA